VAISAKNYGAIKSQQSWGIFNKLDENALNLMMI